MYYPISASLRKRFRYSELSGSHFSAFMDLKCVNYGASTLSFLLGTDGKLYYLSNCLHQNHRLKIDLTSHFLNCLLTWNLLIIRISSRLPNPCPYLPNPYQVHFFFERVFWSKLFAFLHLEGAKDLVFNSSSVSSLSLMIFWVTSSIHNFTARPENL